MKMQNIITISISVWFMFAPFLSKAQIQIATAQGVCTMLRDNAGFPAYADSFSVVNQPSNGSIKRDTIVQAHRIVYCPDSTYVGNDQFTITLCPNYNGIITCSAYTYEVTIGACKLITKILRDTSNCNPGQLAYKVKVDSSSAPEYTYTYNWSNGNGVPIACIRTNTPTFCVTVTDGNGCSGTSCYPTVTGITTTTKNLDFAIVPNPTSSMVTLRGELGAGSIYEVTNQLGQILMTGEVKASSTYLNISNLSGGVYLVKVISGDKIGIQRLTVTR